MFLGHLYECLLHTSLKVSLYLGLTTGTNKAHLNVSLWLRFSILPLPLKAFYAAGELMESNSKFVRETKKIGPSNPVDAIVIEWKAEWKLCDMKNNLIFRQYHRNIRKA